MTALVTLFLVASVITVTFFVALAGIQIVRFLHQLNLSLAKLNRLLDHTTQLSQSAAKPVAAINTFYSEVQDLIRQTQEEIISETPDRVITPPHHLPASSPSGHRFFRRSGLPLRPS